MPLTFLASALFVPTNITALVSYSVGLSTYLPQIAFALIMSQLWGFLGGTSNQILIRGNAAVHLPGSFHEPEEEELE